MTDSALQPGSESAADRPAPELALGPAVEIRACWNKIGVYGDGSCPELAKFVHCRNCTVFSNASLQLLDRPLPEDYRQAWTTHYAQKKQAAASGNVSAVLFRIAAEWLAFPTQVMQEVAEPRRVHSLPHRRQGIVLGLANVRGELLICISLGHLLGIEGLPGRERLRTAHHRLMVVSWDGVRLAFPVDEVQGTHRLQAHELRSPPATVAKANPNYTQGVLYWRERTVGFLNTDLVFSTLNRSLT